MNDQATQTLPERPIGPQGIIIEKRLSEIGMSRYALAKRVGVTHPYMIGVVRGDRRLTKPETIAKTAEALQTDTDQFYIAIDRLPPDIVEGTVRHPDLVPLIRRMIRRKDEQ